MYRRYFRSSGGGSQGKITILERAKLKLATTIIKRYPRGFSSLAGLRFFILIAFLSLLVIITTLIVLILRTTSGAFNEVDADNFDIDFPGFENRLF